MFQWSCVAKVKTEFNDYKVKLDKYYQGGQFLIIESKPGNTGSCDTRWSRDIMKGAVAIWAINVNIQIPFKIPPTSCERMEKLKLFVIQDHHYCF